MSISHEILTDMYNQTNYHKDYNYFIFEENRKKLADILETAADSFLSLFINHKNGKFVFILVDKKTNYISNKNILYQTIFDINQIKAKNIMNRFSIILKELKEIIEINQIFVVERIRGFHQIPYVDDLETEFDPDIGKNYDLEESDQD